MGLLEPDQVDPDTGYRYYAPDQIPAAQIIRRLRDLDMPIPDVTAVLATADTAARGELIAAHLDRLETELARTRSAVESLRNLLRRPATAAVEHRTVPVGFPPATVPALARSRAAQRGGIVGHYPEA